MNKIKCDYCGEEHEEGIETCKAMIRDMDESMKELAKQQEEGYKKDQEILDFIKNEVTPKLYKEIEEEMGETEGAWNLDIVNDHLGTEELTGKVWVDQTTNGGYSGDEFSGCCYFKLPSNRYLKWDYAC